MRSLASRPVALATAVFRLASSSAVGGALAVRLRDMATETVSAEVGGDVGGGVGGPLGNGVGAAEGNCVGGGDGS